MYFPNNFDLSPEIKMLHKILTILITIIHVGETGHKKKAFEGRNL